MLVGAYIAPASDFAKGQKTSVSMDSILEKRHATQLAEQLNLAGDLKASGDSPRGDVLGVSHIHHMGLAEQNWGKPSILDENQVNSYFVDKKFESLEWIVATRKPDGKVAYTAIWSHRDENNEVVHTPIPIIESFEEPGKDVRFERLDLD